MSSSPEYDELLAYQREWNLEHETKLKRNEVERLQKLQKIENNRRKLRDEVKNYPNPFREPA